MTGIACWIESDSKKFERIWIDQVWATINYPRRVRYRESIIRITWEVLHHFHDIHMKAAEIMYRRGGGEQDTGEKWSIKLEKSGFRPEEYPTLTASICKLGQQSYLEGNVEHQYAINWTVNLSIRREE
ncbi:unnamed protein product [Dovyalis caffra]|uniref:Uncharacterized protein n=1 Tax=Dovyalis caffra TaxID=77055 RepID=A0AAV1SAA0_9ROSI|nr:unnamed protein product [Dovyalis caffra]